MATQSMAAALAASLPAPVAPQAESQPQVTKVPQRLEGVVDPEALRDVESVSLNSLVRVISFGSTLPASNPTDRGQCRVLTGAVLTLRCSSR
jgi:hypothetical protein